MKTKFFTAANLLLMLFFSIHHLHAADCLQFDGIDDRVTTTQQVLNSIGNTDFTFEANIIVDPSNTGGHIPVISNRSGGISNITGVLFFVLNAKELAIQLIDAPGTYSTYFFSNNGNYKASLKDGKCHHVAITRQANLLSFYIDGGLLGTKTIVPAKTVAGSTPMLIGRDAFDKDSFLGSIADVRIWNVARTQSQINSNIQVPLSGLEAELVANWQMNEGSGQILKDISANSYDGYAGTNNSAELTDPSWGSNCCFACNTAVINPVIIFPESCTHQVDSTRLIDQGFPPVKGNPCENGNDRQDCILTCDSTILHYEAVLHAGSTYKWEVFGGTIIGSDNLPTVDVEWGEIGPAFIKLIETDALGCMDSIEHCIEFLRSPRADFTANDGCLNTPTYFNYIPNDASEWCWDFGDGSPVICGSNYKSINHTYTTSGTHTVCLVAKNYHYNCWWNVSGATQSIHTTMQEVPCKSECFCTDTIKKEIVIDPLIGPDIECVSTVCAGEEVCYETKSICSNYIWSISANGTITNGGGSADNFVCVVWNSGDIGDVSLAVPSCGSYCSIPTAIQIPIIDDNTLTINGPNPVCAGENVQYEVPKFAGAVYDWSISANGTIINAPPYSNIINVIWGNGSTGQVSVKVSHPYLDDGSGNCEAMATLNIDIKNKFTISFGNEVVCQNDVDNYSTFPATNYNWTTTGGTITSTNGGSNITIDWNVAPGIYYVTATSTDPTLYCNTTSTKKVEVKELPETPVIDGPLVICAGGSYTYTASALSVTGKFVWDANGNGMITPVNANTVIVDWNPSGPYTLSVIQESFSFPNCASTPFSINVDPVTSLTINDANVCSNSTSSHTVSTVPALPVGSLPNEEFEWTILPIGTTAGSIVNGQGTNTIDIEWHNYTGSVTVEVLFCGLSQTFVVNVTDPVPPTITGPTTLCKNKTGTLTATGSCYTNYTWEDENGNPLGSGPNINITGGGCYTLYADDCNVNNCPTSATYCVTEIPSVEPEITTPDPLIICTMPTLKPIDFILYATPSSGFTYVWERDCGSGWTPVGANSSALAQTSISSVCKYRVTLADSFSCEYESVNVVSTVLSRCYIPPCIDPIGIVSFDVDAPVCNPVNFINTSVSANNFSWSYGDGTSGTVLPHTYDTPGFYRVCLSGDVPATSPSTCRLTHCETIEVPGAADFVVELNCNDPVKFMNLSSTSANNTATWLWDFGDGNNSTAMNPTNTYTSPGTYTVKLTLQTVNSVTGDICSFIKYETITIPSYTATPAFSSPACVNQDVSFTYGVPFGNEVSWLWDFGDGASSFLQNPKHTYTSAGTKTVSLKITDANGCEHIGSSNITINPLPAVPTLTAAPTEACSGDAIVLTSSTTYGNYNFINAETGVSIQNGSINTVSVFNTGSYMVEVEATGTQCPNKSDAIPAIFYENPPAFIEGDTELCFGESLVLSAPVGYTYEWFIDNITTGAARVLNESGLTVGTYTVELIVTDSSSPISPPCSSKTSVTVNVYPIPAAPAVSSSPGGPLCEGDLATLSVLSPLAGYIYTWSTGDIGTSITTLLTGPVSVTVTSPDGCTNTSTVDVCPLPDVCIVPSGCYTRCNPDTICIPDLYSSYQWLKDGIPIPGATDTCFVATMSGQYQVMLENAWACKSISDMLDLTLIPCDSCAVADKIQVKCDPQNSDYYVNFDIQNVSGITANLIEIRNIHTIPAGPTFTPTGPISIAGPIPDMGIVSAPQFTISGANAGDQFCFLVSVYENRDGLGLCCHTDTICITLPNCTDCCEGTYDEFLQDHVKPGFIVTLATNPCYTIIVDPVATDECMEVYYFWGDGTKDGPFSGLGNNIYHTYPNAGKYDLCMLVIEYDDNGEPCWEDQYCETVYVPECEPCDYSCIGNLDFKFSYKGPLTVQFASPNIGLNNCQRIVAQQWTFSGGSPSSSSLANPVVTYSSWGWYSATLTVQFIDQFGNECESGISKQFFILGVIIIDDPFDIPFELECVEDDLFIANIPINSCDIQAGNSIESKAIVETDSIVKLKAGEYVELQAGFEVETGAEFEAAIETCETTGCCPTNPLEEAFLQQFTNEPIYSIDQTTNSNGDCIFRVRDACNPFDITTSFYDCVGNLICENFQVGTSCDDAFLEEESSYSWISIKMCTN